MISVARLSIAPVKSLGLVHPDEIRLERFGVAQDRRFLPLTGEGKLLDSRRFGRLMAVTAGCDEAGERLTMRFPDGTTLEDAVTLQGSAFGVQMWEKRVDARHVDGPWSGALSEFVGTTVRLARTERPGDGTDDFPVSLVSLASVEELSRQGGRKEPVDAGRFRMTFELDGCRPHEEDGWLGREIRVGEAVIRVSDHDARCAITTMDPLTGRVDFPTLKTIAAYRGADDGHLLFGMYAEVARAGTVRVGDPVEPVPA